MKTSIKIKNRYFLFPHRIRTHLFSIYQLILPVSSWAQWAGLLSNANEIHVNAPPVHPMMPGMSQYIYHNEKKKLFFGKYSNSTKDVEFEWRPPNKTTLPSIEASQPEPIPIPVSMSTLYTIVLTNSSSLNLSSNSINMIVGIGEKNKSETGSITVPLIGLKLTEKLDADTRNAVSTKSPIIAARGVVSEKFSLNNGSGNSLPPIKDSPSVLSEEDSLFERLRIKGSTVATWWWELMAKKE